MPTLYGIATAALADVLPLAHWGDDDGPGWLFGLVFWLALIAVVMLVLRNRGWLGHGTLRAQPGESARGIIERRFAEGRLSAEELRQRRAVLDECGDGEGGEA